MFAGGSNPTPCSQKLVQPHGLVQEAVSQGLFHDIKRYRDGLKVHLCFSCSVTQGAKWSIKDVNKFVEGEKKKKDQVSESSP